MRLGRQVERHGLVVTGEKEMIDESEYVGKTIEEARKIAESKGMSFRISMVDEITTMSTADLRHDRVNVKVSGGIVEGAYPG